MDDVEATADGHYSTEDLFELVWQAAKGGGGGRGGATVSSLQSTTSSSSYQVVPAILPLLGSSPSEDVMAAWLYPIVSGHDQDHAGGDDALGQPVVAKQASEKSQGMSLGTKDTNTSEKKAPAVSGSASRKVSSDHYSRAHNLTEKKRRCRINEKLRTLQRLVPGCDKQSNQVSTLEQTIRYIKSLQQQVQVMNTWSAPPPALYPPFAMPMPPLPPPTVVAPRTPPAQMVPFSAMLPYPHYQAIIMPAAAVVAPQEQSGAAPGAPAAGRRLCPRPKNGSRESRS
uniref:Uncharacterized protein n=1 Tax=Avena sativa TaxID=4498 RepID=A0ACD5UW15_AVESA